MQSRTDEKSCVGEGIWGIRKERQEKSRRKRARKKGVAKSKRTNGSDALVTWAHLMEPTRASKTHRFQQQPCLFFAYFTRHRNQANKQTKKKNKQTNKECTKTTLTPHPAHRISVTQDPLCLAASLSKQSASCPSS